VSLWQDQSGFGRDASQLVGPQPAYSATAMNGYPAIVGDGSSTFMTTSSFTFGAAVTMAVAVRPSVAPVASFARILETDYATSYYLGVNSTGGAYKLIVNNGVFPFGAAEGGTVVAANQLVTAVYGSGTGTLYIDGSAVGMDLFSAPTSASKVLTLLRWAGGASEYFNGALGEVIIYDRALSTSELKQLHRYLGGRYGVRIP